MNEPAGNVTIQIYELGSSDFFDTKQASRFYMLTLSMKSKERLLNGDLGLV